MEALRVRFVGRNVGATHSERTGPCSKCLGSEACQSDVSRRVRGEDDGKLLTIKWNILDVEFVGKLDSAMKGLHDPQLLAVLLRPFGPQHQTFKSPPLPMHCSVGVAVWLYG